MLRKKEECRTEIIPHFKNGDGSFSLFHIAQSEEMGNRVSLFAQGTLPTGASVGMHTHEGTMEICYFLSGSGKVTERDTAYMVGPGDVSICFDGEQHQVVNIGEQPLSYIVFVLKTE